MAFINLTKGNADHSKVRTVSRWPGKVSESKVPTILSYDKVNVERGPTSWGFTSKTESEQGSNRLVGQWFKKRFDQGSPGTIHGDDGDFVDQGLPRVETLYFDYLSMLYNHIKNTFSIPNTFENGSTWDSASIEFVFSIPGTWENSTTTKFLDIAAAAGFGQHKIGECLTEPQAVAVFALKEEDRIGKVCLNAHQSPREKDRQNWSEKDNKNGIW